MPMMINREAFERLIAEDLAWLHQQPRSLERMHIETLLRNAPEAYYRRPRRLDESPAERQWNEMRERQAQDNEGPAATGPLTEDESHERRQG